LDPDGSRPVGLPGNTDWTATTDQNCPEDCSDFGTRVGTAGDVNGDGYDDIFVGAPRYDNDHTDEGMVSVWYGGLNGLGDNGTTANADWKAESNQTSARLSGYSEAHWTCCADTVDNVNDDGYWTDGRVARHSHDGGVAYYMAGNFHAHSIE
jgi:hypothetical protein